MRDIESKTLSVDLSSELDDILLDILLINQVPTIVNLSQSDFEHLKIRPSNHRGGGRGCVFWRLQYGFSEWLFFNGTRMMIEMVMPCISLSDHRCCWLESISVI